MRWCLVRLSLLLASSLLAAQTSSEIPVPTIRATTRLVLVNVVASDNSGKPVSNLDGNSFKVFENGKPQKTTIFDFEGLAASKSEARPALPPNIFTNRPSFHSTPGPLTLILLDTLNTPARDQVYARRKLLSYLQTQLQPGQRLAIFSLGEQLRLLQDFTTDPEPLRSAIQGVSPEPSKELSLEDVKAATPPPPRDAAAAAPYLRMLSSLKQLLAERGQMSVDGRVATTLSAFRMIARAVAGYPGRKNLIWVSGSFPLAFTMVADFGHTYRLNEIVSSRSYEHDIRETASQMGDAQISIYPVDARGLIGAETVDSAEPMNNELGQVYSGSEISGVVSKNSDDRLNSQASMQEIARATGGLAYINRNDIDRAVALSVSDGSSYYTLGYYPTDKNWDGRFRTIEIKTDRKDLQLRYRNGYFAVDPTRPDENPKARDNDLTLALRNDPMPSTMVIFDVRIVPPAWGTTMAVPVDFLVNTDTL
jgi:VWFA-related protein